MKPNQLATLVLRLMGIYCLIQMISLLGASFGSLVVYLRDREDSNSLLGVAMVLLPLVGYLLVGLTLLACSIPWGEKLTQDIGGENITAISFEQLQVLTFAVAGVLIFTSALPQLFNSIYSLVSWVHAAKDSPAYLSTYTRHNVLTAAGTLIKAALGLWLFFRARGFANLWRSLRTFATPKPPQE